MGSEHKRGRWAGRSNKVHRAKASAALALKEREVAANRENLSALMDEQKAVLERAAAIVKDAGLQFGTFTREEVTPKVRDTMTHHVKPFLAGGAAATALAGHTAKKKFKEDVLPAVSGAVGKATEFGKRIGKESSLKAETLGKKVGIVETKPAPAGPGRYILIGLGVVALAGLAYAVWQTLRADDDLWIEDEPDALDEDLSIEPESNAPASSI